MTNQHPITPPDELVEKWITEIWHEGTPVRVAASDLHIAAQAAQWGHQQRVRSAPGSPLVERVADAIAAQATSAGIVNDRPARAAIRVVAEWLRSELLSRNVADLLDNEANR